MNYLEIGKIVNTHGIRGEIKLNPWTDDVEDLITTAFFYLKEGESYRRLDAERVRIHKNCAIIKLKGIDDMTTAESFRGKLLFVKKEDELPEGRYYIADLIGLLVKTEQESIGELTDVLQTGAHDIYEVTTKEGKKILIPAVSEFIKDINLVGGYVLVELIEGFLE